MSKTTAAEPAITEHQAASERLTLGFWTYLMTDLVLFASLFATYVILRNNSYGGPTEAEIFSLPFVFVETMLLLTSSFTAGLAMLAVHRGAKKQALLLLAITFALGAAFLGMEIYEFRHLIVSGESWRVSGFLSAFFTLVGTHGLHILIGLLWLSVLFVQVLRRGLRPHLVTGLGLFSLFWHFLDIVWIFIFTIVYLMGVL